MPYSFKGKKISEKQWIRLLQKGSTVNLKGFNSELSGETIKIEGLIRFNKDFQLILEPKKTAKPTSEILTCPKCKKGNVIKGKTAYGCSAYNNGCDFIFSFDDVREKANGQVLTKALVHSILKEKH